MTYKGCKITTYKGKFVWDELLYGMESDDAFDTIEATKADIDQFFGNGSAPRLINNEIYV